MLKICVILRRKEKKVYKLCLQVCLFVHVDNTPSDDDGIGLVRCLAKASHLVMPSSSLGHLPYTKNLFVLRSETIRKM